MYPIAKGKKKRKVLRLSRPLIFVNRVNMTFWQLRLLRFHILPDCFLYEMKMLPNVIGENLMPHSSSMRFIPFHFFFGGEREGI